MGTILEVIMTCVASCTKGLLPLNAPARTQFMIHIASLIASEKYQYWPIYTIESSAG
jgi:hypothetical protein